MTASPQLSPTRAPRLPKLRVERSLDRPRSALARVFETLALATLFGISLEGGARIEDWVRYRTPVFVRERSQQDLLIRDANGMHGRPGGRFQKWSLNAFGMRGPDVSAVKAPRVVRVVTAGASETFGLYESADREYPRQLQDSLNAGLRLASRQCVAPRAEVLNAAMPGMSLPTIDQDIRLRVRQLNPDFVVLYATPAVYLDDAAPIAARPDSSSRGVELPARYALFPRVADRIRTQLKTLLPAVLQDRIRQRQIRRMLAAHPSGWRFDSVPAERLALFETDLRRTVGTIRTAGAVPVLVTHANRFAGSSNWDSKQLHMWEKFYPRASGPTIVAFDSAARLATMAVARDSGTVLVDLRPILARSRGVAFADYAHFTDAGAALTAGSVSAAILRSAAPKSAACGQAEARR